MGLLGDPDSAPPTTGNADGRVNPVARGFVDRGDKHALHLALDDVERDADASARTAWTNLSVR